MTVTDVRSASDVLRHSRDVVDPVLRAAVDTIPDATRRVVGYHFGWWDGDGRPIDVDGGKGFRPALALLAAQAVGGRAAAAAVELVHNHSLVHDDVMDGDATRRHRPTVWRVFWANAAIQAGDALLSLAFGVLAGSRHPAAVEGALMVNAAALSLVDGQVRDLAFERRADVSRSECLRMTRAKTGALMACACAVGALFGGGRPEQVEHLRAFGEHLGMAFQHVDDLLGVWGSPDATGKPVYTDLRSRKKSLPVVAALTSGTPAGHELAALYHRPDPLSDAELAGVAGLIDEAGGRAWSQARAGDELATARHHLRSADPVAQPAHELEALARLATSREC
jgi:geranylgeranyl diphosphate synthase type I